MEPEKFPNYEQPSSHAEATLNTSAFDRVPGEQIGAYRLIQLLGGGGMGEVWLAEQKTPFRRKVALKLIKAGMDTKAVVARFESERQALALMDHPNIAQVYDAGSTPEGRPYFVMEYVPGLPITEYCDKHNLTMKERAGLFIQVCAGVQHAHQKAIIHRDLKPSNVLVLEQNDEAVPKIIDFGLAKAMAQRLTEKTFFTEIGVLVGTPEYMSPEQADLIEQNVDTRTDVYSLGMILYELLVGALPFDTKTLRAAGLEAILRVIREQEPPRPSTKVRMMGPDSAASAEKRREEPRSFARHLQGELDWITLKALEKDRTRRYGTPSELAADISRYLNNEPVLARPASTGYRLGKYVRRHRVGVGVAAGVALLLVGFGVLQTVQLRRTIRERDRANRITDFMTGMFKVSDPSQARGNSITAREVLDKASSDIDTGLAHDPELQGELIRTMGVVYLDLGLYPRAEQLFTKALNIDLRSIGPRNPAVLKVKTDLAYVYTMEGRFQQAEELDRQTLSDLIRVLGPDHPDTLSTESNLAAILTSEQHYPEAERLDRDVLEERRRILGPENRDTLGSIANLAMVLFYQGRVAEAEKLDREVLEQRLRVLGPDHPDTLQSMTNLGLALQAEGQFPEAEKLLRETADTRAKVLGPEHPDTASATYNVACILAHEGQRDQAIALLRQAIDHGLPLYIDAVIDKDDDLQTLHGDPQFTALVAYAKQHASGSATSAALTP